MRISGLLAVSIFIIGASKCSGKPKPPEIHQCGVYGPNKVWCEPSENNNEEERYETTIEQMLAFQCVSPEDHRQVLNHYEELKIALRECQSKRRRKNRHK
jgi:hypothetical protein